MDNSCCFCRLANHDQCEGALHTELFYEDEYVIIVEDDHSRQYDLRLLAVWKEHKPYEELGEWARIHMTAHLLEQVRQVKRYGFRFEALDTEKHSVPGHEHWQACLVRRGGE